VSLAVVRNISSPLAFRSGEDVEDFEQELVDQYALAMAAAGLSDGHVSSSRSTVIEFARSLSGPLRRQPATTPTGSWPTSAARAGR
jgi:hypothetical protein